MTASTADTLHAAHDYARRGWRVIPLHHVVDDGGACSCRAGSACKSAGKHPVPARWPERASAYGADVAAWWNERPHGNVGIATGEQSGLFVLDVDPDSGGSETLAALEAEHGALPRTRTVRTGPGGRHFYFGWPGFDVTNSAGKLGSDLDIRTPEIHGSVSSHALAYGGRWHRWHGTGSELRKRAKRRWHRGSTEVALT